MSFWEVAAPTWLQGVGTVGAFATGGVILIRELRRDRAQLERQERAQAAAVSAWLVRVDPDGAGQRMVTRCVLNNAADTPVYDLTVTYLDPGGRRATDTVGVVPPGRMERALPAGLDETWVKTTEGWLRSKEVPSLPVVDPRKAPWSNRLSLSFRDSAGIKWHRADNGILEKGPVTEP